MCEHGILKWNRERSMWASCKDLLNMSSLSRIKWTSGVLTTLVTEEDMFLLAEKLVESLQGPHRSFASFLNYSVELFLARSPRNDATLTKRLLYVFCECFRAASHRSLWVHAGLTLCAMAVVEGACLKSLTDKKIVFRSKTFIRKFYELSSSAVDEFKTSFPRKSRILHDTEKLKFYFVTQYVIE